MPAQYHRLTTDEFEDFLDSVTPAWERAEVRGTKELVYDLPLPPEHLSIRLFSTLTRDGVARDAGSDAIRALIWNHEADSIEAGETRTHRIETWRSNLRPKIEHLYDNWRDLATEFSVTDLPESGGADDEVRVVGFDDTRYGRKARLDSPYDAKGAIKDLDWDETHRSWDNDAWQVDADALELVRDSLAESGWRLTRGPDPTEVRLDDFSRGDRIRVTYEPKNREDGSSDELTKEGVVRRAESGRLRFRRDDGQVMRVEDDELYTTGSRFPFVGSVEDVELLD